MGPGTLILCLNGEGAPRVTWLYLYEQPSRVRLGFHYTLRSCATLGGSSNLSDPHFPQQ